MSEKSIAQPLPLFEFFYRPAEVDTQLANQLVVYRYSLPSAETSKEFQSHIEQQVQGYRFAYLLRTQATPNGLYVALHNDQEIPPSVFSADKDELVPERVYYSPVYAPIWIRLIFRRMSVWDHLCQGYHRGGIPLLVIDSWSGKGVRGIEALSLDCSSFDPDADGICRVTPFYAGVSLMGVSSEEASDPKQQYWEYSEKKILHRYIKTAGVQPRKALYRVYKPKNKPVEPDFLDLTSVKKFKQSRPVVLLEIVDSFIEHAALYGFNVQQRELNLRPWGHKTRPIPRKKGFTFGSITPATKIDVIDLRVATQVSARALLSMFSDWLRERDIDVQWQLLADVTAQTISSYKAQPPQRILVLIDQLKGMENDQYALTDELSQSCAVQHLMVNPQAINMDPIKRGLLKEYKIDGKSVLIETPNSHFFEYQLEHFETEKCRSALQIKLDVVLKELEIKNLLQNRTASISSVLPNQIDTLNADLLMIGGGSLFTVENDRPVIIPFQVQNNDMRTLCDERLARFGTSVEGLMRLLDNQWPHFYQPIKFSDMVRNIKKLESFQRNLLLIMHRDPAGDVSIMLQEYGIKQRYIMPYGTSAALRQLETKDKEEALQSWFIPEHKVPVLFSLAAELEDEKALTASEVDVLKLYLERLVRYWNNQLKIQANDNKSVIAYPAIKRLALSELKTDIDKKPSTTFIKSLDILLTRYFKRSLRDPRVWLRTVPGLQGMHVDHEHNFFIVGTLSPLKLQLARQPGIRQWHPIQGEIDVDLICKLLDVDWVRMNQLAGNPSPLLLINRWNEIHAGTALLAE